MKKFLFMALLAFVMVACGNDDEPEKASATLNVSELVGYVGKTADYVKANIKGATLQNEGGSLGKTTLTYTLPTDDVRLSVTFKTNTSGEITNVDVYGKYDGYDKGVECFKKEMDKINATISHDTYIARYYSNTAGAIDFQDRTEFWNYVAENNVSKQIQETWWIENSARTKFNVDAIYTRGSNSISIEIEKNVW